ncbi:hypothetical protein [Helicobacter cholecystus]|uniref:hypothetical protein n=1 Tax=Helicobacter cholecystus TaxID=45498 RepID=UPI0027383BF1|nr:hypothetical protein [Helicobacter cholecystus]
MTNEIKVSQCFDLFHELEKASIVLKIDSKNLSFDIVGVSTFLSEEPDGVRQELNEAKTRDFFYSGSYEDNQYYIAQAYDLVIKKKEKHQPEHFFLELEAEDSELYFVFDAQSEEWLLDNLLEVKKGIDRKKASYGVIFKDFSLNFDAEVLREKITSAQKTIGGKKKFLLEKSKFYHPNIEAHFFFTLKEEWEYCKKMSVENSSYAVKSGMEVGRLYKAKNGSDGRNLKGEYIKIEKKELQDLEFSALEDDFNIQDCEDYIVYLGSKTGFVGLNSSGLILIKENDFEEINNRNMGNLLGGIECEIEINVKASIPEKDAIGAGMIIEAQKLNVTGGVDQGVILRTQECNINGFTHQNVEIFAKKADIGILRGTLKAEEVKIKMCEGGNVDCTVGEFEEMVGAEVMGKEISVKTLHSNNKIYISSKVSIEEMKGGGNYFCIDSSAFLDYREEIAKIKKRHNKYLEAIDKLGKIYKQELIQTKRMKPAVDRFREIFVKNIQSGMRTQPYILSTIGEYMGLCRRLKRIKQKIQQYQEQSAETLKEIEPIMQVSLEGRIECKGAWVQQNLVEFVDALSDKREVMNIEEGEKVNVYVDANYHKLLKERI